MEGQLTQQEVYDRLAARFAAAFPPAALAAPASGDANAAAASPEEAAAPLALTLFWAERPALGAPPVEELDGSLGQVIAQAQTLKNSASQLRSVIERADRTLGYPQEVADSLGKLSSGLRNLSTALDIAKVVRPIRPAAEILAFNVNGLRAAVGAAEGQARALASLAQPLRRALQALAQALGEIVRRLDELISHTTNLRSKISTVAHCMSALPAGEARTRGLAMLDDFARAVQPVAGATARSLAEINGQIAAISSGLMAIEQQLQAMRNAITGGIDAVLRVISPLLGPLEALASALDYRINLKIFSFSIRDILNGLSLPWPFSYLEDLFWDGAMSILKPILNALHLDVLLPSIPGLDILRNLRPELPGLPRLAAELGALPGAFGNLRGLLDRFKIDCPPKLALTAPLFSEELMAELADAEPRLVTTPN